MGPLEPREMKRPSGHVVRVEGPRGAVWYARYRLPSGRQVKKRLGPAAPERARPPAGYFTRRLAEDWLADTLDSARRRTLPGMVATGATFADAAAEYLRYAEQDRGCKPSTLRDYRSRPAAVAARGGPTRVLGRWVGCARHATSRASANHPVMLQVGSLVSV
jgi:hypothetical protein